MSKNSLNQLARIIRDSQTGSQIARENNNYAKPTYGTITDVNDPEERGRVKLVIDEVNPEIHTEQGWKDDGQATVTDWMEPKVPFKGKQPEAVVGLRVPVEPKQGDPNRLFFGSPVNDPDETKKAGAPKNSDMVRLPVYPSGSLPAADEENVGCMVIEEGGPCSSDWLCVCLRRRGKWLWIRHIDLNHMHADQDDGRQPPDSAGDGEAPVDEGPIWDKVAPTSDKAYDYQGYDEMDSGFFGGA
jgi:hypothetical protein